MRTTRRRFNRTGKENDVVDAIGKPRLSAGPSKQTFPGSGYQTFLNFKVPFLVSPRWMDHQRVRTASVNRDLMIEFPTDWRLKETMGEDTKKKLKLAVRNQWQSDEKNQLIEMKRMKWQCNQDRCSSDIWSHTLQSCRFNHRATVQQNQNVLKKWKVDPST